MKSQYAKLGAPGSSITEESQVESPYELDIISTKGDKTSQPGSPEVRRPTVPDIRVRSASSAQSRSSTSPLVTSGDVNYTTTAFCGHEQPQVAPVAPDRKPRSNGTYQTAGPGYKNLNQDVNYSSSSPE